MKSRIEISAGGVVFRRNSSVQVNSVEVLICKDAGYHKWVLPKGLVDKGEDIQQTALREVAEEVGVTTHIITTLGDPEKYVYSRAGIRIFKTVHYFLMEYESGNETDHDHEMEEVRWVALDEAANLLAYDGAKAILRRAVEYLTNSTPTNPA